MNRRILWALLIETIGTVVFNVGWWMDWPPMVLFGVLLAVTGLDLWDERAGGNGTGDDRVEQ